MNDLFRSILHQEPNYRRRLQAELLEVEEALSWGNTENPLLVDLKNWHERYFQLLKTNVIGKKKIARFVKDLEEIFENALRKNRFFNAKFLFQNASQAVVFLFHKMHTPYSLFYSNTFHAKSEKIEKKILKKRQEFTDSVLQPNYRRRIRAELLEIKDVLNQSELNPLMARLNGWYARFSFKVKRSAIGQEEVSHFLLELEKIFETPSQFSFSAELFSTHAPEVVRFMVEKMRKQHSLLYSKRLNLAFDQIERARKEEEFQNNYRLVCQIQSEREKKKSKSRAIIEKTTKQLKKEDEKNRKQLKKEDKKLKAQFDEMEEEICETKKKAPVVKKQSKNEEKKLSLKLGKLGKNINKMKKKKKGTKEKIKALEASNNALQGDMNKEYEKRKKKKENLGLTALKIGGSLLASYVFGTSVNFVGDSTTIGYNVPL